MKSGIGSSYRKKLSAVINASKGVITANLVCSTLGVSTHEASRLLYRWNRSGWVNRVKRGVYVPIPVEVDPNSYSVEDPWIVASRIYSPGYIAGFSAIDHWDLSEQIFETVFFFTTKVVNKREIKLGGISLKLKTISNHKFFGTKVIWRNNNKVLISDPTKTILDLFDDPKVAGGMRNLSDCYKEYLTSEFANFDLLLDYADRLGNHTVFKRIGCLNEILGVYPEMEGHLISKLSKGYSVFDPTVNNSKIIRKWNLKVPASWKVQYDRKK